MKKLKEKLDPKYTKIALYASVATILTIVILMILFTTRGMWAFAWNLIMRVLKPLIIGGVLCYLMEPLVKFFDQKLQKIGKKEWNSRGLAVLITFVIVFGVISAILTVIIWSMTKQLTSIDYQAITKLFNNTHNDALGLLKQVEKYLNQVGMDVATIGMKIPGIFGAIASGVSTIFFGIIFAIYFLIDGKRISRYWKNAGKVVLSEKTIQVLMQMSKEADTCFSGYIRGQALDALLVGTIASIALILVGHPYAFLIGLIIGIGNLIPYVGPILGYASVIIVNITDYNLKMLVIGLAIIAILMFIDGNIINPKLLSGTIKVHPLLVIASLLAGGALGGIAGMIVAVPMGAFVKLQFEKWIAAKKNEDSKSEDISKSESNS